ncbi:MAG: putative manganese transporter, partial [Clostridia bacterium]|nr:putative manganese transporter [Clostridia bacterium]
VFLMEYIEHRAAERFENSMRRAGRFGPLLGGALGIVPQCGFSAACAELFNGGLVSAGTLAAVFLSTSDEAIPILIANPSGIPVLWKLILIKLAVAVAAGLLIDTLWPLRRQREAYAVAETPHRCTSDGRFISILWATLKRTLSILLFLFLITLLLNLLIAWIGEERLSRLLLPGFFQPMIAAVIGFIPNCAASVLLTQLYLDGMISFGSAVAGLCSASGIGLIVLLRGRRGFKACAIILLSVFAAAVLAGLVLQWLM